jgi:hypothetical protein
MICPLYSAGTCKAKIDLDHFLKYCSNITEDAYKNCQFFKEQAGGARSPAEWGRLLGTGPMTTRA